MEDEFGQKRLMFPPCNCDMAKQIKEIVCITCPLGCRMEVAIEDGKLLSVAHNTCKRGIQYAESEVSDPRRMVTATASLTGGVLTRVPVRTSAPLPIQYIPELLRAIYDLTIAAPIPIHTPVIRNFAATEIDIITTRTMTSAE